MPRSVLSLIIPTRPRKAGSHRSLTLVIGRLILVVLYAMPVKPDCHGIVNRLPGS